MFKMIIDTINQSYRCIFPYDYIIHAPNIDIHSLKYHSKLDHSIRNQSTVIKTITLGKTKVYFSKKEYFQTIKFLQACALCRETSSRFYSVEFRP
jgi:hypothetical protein